MASKAATRCSLHLLLSLVLAVVLLASCSSADNASPRDWTVETFPDPQHQPEACGRPGVALSRVCDPDGLLNEKSKDIIEGLIIKVDEGSEPYAKRKCGGEEKGFEIGVVIMAGFASNHGELPAHAAARMARGIHDKWGVGSGTCNNGLLLLASLRERQIYISTGSGANNHLSNSATDNVIELMRPFMRSDRHGEALESAVHHLGLFLAEDAAKPGSWAWFKDMIPLLVFIPVVGMLFFGSKQQTTYNDCMKKLKKLKEDQDVLRAEGKFQSVNCPICFEDFDKPVGEDRDELQPKEGVLSVINGEAGPSGSAADKKGKAKEEAKAGKTVKPLVLPCGHAFCFPCIAEWVQQKKTQCPICRDPIDDSTPRPTRPPPAPCTAGAQATAGAQGAATATAAGGSSSTYTQDAPADPTDEADPFQMGAEGEGSNAHRQAFPRRGWRERRQDQLNAELLFRLMTLRNRYPRYITPEMHAGWQHDIQTGTPMSQSLMTQFDTLNPSYDSGNAARRGHGGASRSFGGGRSSSGRGGGY